MKRLQCHLKYLFCLCLFAQSACAWAQASAIQLALLASMPDIQKIDSITASPIPGLYEVVSNGSVYYSDSIGKYVLKGNLINLHTKQNLTQQKIEKLNAIDFDSLPLKDAFTVVNGNGSRKIAIFSDPNCPYCKQLERELLGLSDVTVHIFLYPILNQDSKEKAKAIWCAADKRKSWQDWMIRGVQPGVPACDDFSSVKRNVDFGRSHRMTGIPVVVMADGTQQVGLLKTQKLEAFITSAAAN